MYFSIQCWNLPSWDLQRAPCQFMAIFGENRKVLAGVDWIRCKWDVRAKYLKEKGSKGLSYKDTTQQLYSTTSQVIVFWLFWQHARVNLKHTWDWGIRLKHNSEGWWGTIRLLEMVEVGGASKVWQRAPVLCQLRTTLWYCTMILYDIVLHLKC